MCNCASCEYTDGFKDKGFAAWPRGKPAGKSSARDYQAHVRYSLQWGRGYDGTMHEPKECTTSKAGTRAAPERLIIPSSHWEGGGYRGERKWIEAPTTTVGYIAEFERLNGLKKQEPIKAPARPAKPAKAPRHFPAQDRPRETARIYAMPKAKPVKRQRGRPAIPGRFVVVKLEERLIAKAEKLGGKVAAGIREALERVKVG